MREPHRPSGHGGFRSGAVQCVSTYGSGPNRAMMRQLDCSSFETALRSLANSLCIEEGDLRARLVRNKPDAGFKADLRRWSYEDLVLERCDLECVVPDSVVWFHGTRVPPETTFSDGLLPLASCIERLQAVVTEIADSLAIPEGVGSASPSFCMKLQRLPLQGPNGSLLRDAVLRPKRPQRDFLRSPEIVDDLAEERGGERFGEIVAEYRRRTKSCIVTFQSREPRVDVVKQALAYCHGSLHGQDEPTHWNTCFNGGGRPVLASDILKVEWLAERR